MEYTKEDKSRIVKQSSEGYDMAEWKVEEIYDMYHPKRFYEMLEEALIERERMNECEW